MKKGSPYLKIFAWGMVHFGSKRGISSSFVESSDIFIFSRFFSLPSHTMSRCCGICEWKLVLGLLTCYDHFFHKNENRGVFLIFGLRRETLKILRNGFFVWIVYD